MYGGIEEELPDLYNLSVVYVKLFQQLNNQKYFEFHSHLAEYRRRRPDRCDAPAEWRGDWHDSAADNSSADGSTPLKKLSL